MIRKMNGNGRKGDQESDQTILNIVLRRIAEIAVLVLLLFHVIELVLLEFNSLMRNKLL